MEEAIEWHGLQLASSFTTPTATTTILSTAPWKARVSAALFSNTSGTKYHLPTAEYNYSADRAIDTVLIAAKRAAAKTGNSYEVLVTQSDRRRWYNVPEAPPHDGMHGVANFARFAAPRLRRMGEPDQCTNLGPPAVISLENDNVSAGACGVRARAAGGS